MHEKSNLTIINYAGKSYIISIYIFGNTPKQPYYGKNTFVFSVMVRQRESQFSKMGKSLISNIRSFSFPPLKVTNKTENTRLRKTLGRTYIQMLINEMLMKTIFRCDPGICC